MEVGLDFLQPGRCAVVTQINVDGMLDDRLRDFGFVPGTKVCCWCRGTGGKVTALRFRGTVVAFRTRDLKRIRGRFDD